MGFFLSVFFFFPFQVFIIPPFCTFCTCSGFLLLQLDFALSSSSIFCNDLFIMAKLGLSVSKVKELGRYYRIPSDIKFMVVEGRSTAPEGFMKICEKYLWYGFIIPQVDFQYQVLEHYKMEICQLVPNSISFVVGFELFYKKVEATCTYYFFKLWRGR